MSLPKSERNTVSIMSATTHTLALYALIVVTAEAGLGVAVSRLTGFPQTLTIIGVILVLVLVVVIAGWRYTSPRGVLPPEIVSLWTEEDIPLPQAFAQSLIGRWNCRWTYRTPSGELMPYADDRIDIEDVDSQTGKITGTGLSVYNSEANYKVFGRVSKRRLMHLFYSTPPPMLGLAGVLILRLAPIGEVQGWWLGTGRKGGDIGGSITWTRTKDDQDFQPRLYPVETNAHHS